jgi:hypothetical protein
MIQIERPKNWSTENIYKIAKGIDKIETLNTKLGQKPKMTNKQITDQ